MAGDDPVILDDGAMSARDVTSLVTLFVTMLAQAKGEILSAMEANSTRAADRWTAHEKEHATAMERLATLERAVDSHLKEEAREDLVREVRIRPFKTLTGRIVFHWRDIVILLIAMAALLGISSEALTRLAVQ